MRTHYVPGIVQITSARLRLKNEKGKAYKHLTQRSGSRDHDVDGKKTGIARPKSCPLEMSS